MRKQGPWFLIAALILAVILVIYYLMQQQSTSIATGQNTTLALFTTGQSDEHRLVDWKHIQLQLNAGGKDPLELDELNKIRNRDTVLLSLHSYPRKKGGNPLQEMLEGAYDTNVRVVQAWLQKRQAPVYFRYNPQPEVPVKDQPWQYQSPNLYIKAFRHLADQLRQSSSQAKMVYGATGYPGCMEYHPGDAYVDLNSIVLYPQSEAKLNAYPIIDSLPQMLKRRLHRLRFSAKDVLILKGRNMKRNIKLSHLQSVKEEFKKLVQYRAETRPTKRRLTTPDKFLVGLYDPQERLVNEPGVDVEHLFLNMANIENGPFKKDLQAALERGHQVVVTAEPFKDSLGNHDREILTKVINGEYDPYIEQLYEVLKNTDQTVYLRFAHEMEIPIERYPWQSQDPLEYIKAFRYFMTYPDSMPEHIQRVWGPAGDRGSMEWYPGDDIVDYISIAVYGLPDKGIEDHRQQESFREIFERKVHRMRHARAPIFVTEFGVKGPEDFQKQWLVEAGKTLRSYPTVVGACYFNLYDNPEVWGKDMEAPDWSISKNSFEAFQQSLR